MSETSKVESITKDGDTYILRLSCGHEQRRSPDNCDKKAYRAAPTMKSAKCKVCNPPPSGPKECTDCGEEKDRSEFFKSLGASDGLQKRCKVCQKLYVKQLPPMKPETKEKKRRDRAASRKRGITIDDLKSLLRYDPETGDFIRLTTVNGFKAGSKAGALRTTPTSNTSYIMVGIKNTSYHAHRLAWFYMTGEWPDQVDHINGDGTDNSWANLRAVDGTLNQRNIPLRKANKTGIHGVRLTEQGSFQVTIGLNNKTMSLGTHKDFFEACCARKSAENKYGYHANHGRKSQ